VHLSVVTPLESPCALTACEFLPSFGLAKPLAAMFGVGLGTLTIQLLHSSAVGEIAHVSLLNAPHRSFVLSKTEKEKTERLTLLARARMVPEPLFGPVPWAAMNCYDVAYAPGSKEGGNIVRKFLLASVFVIAGSHPALASDVAFEDIIGRWCLSESADNITFTKTQSLVRFADGRNKTLTIEKIEVEKNAIHVYWAPHLGATIYELSDDRRTLVQLPNTAGDMGPRRQLRRC
jgi:hypothetical protein